MQLVTDKKLEAMFDIVLHHAFNQRNTKAFNLLAAVLSRSNRNAAGNSKKVAYHCFRESSRARIFIYDLSLVRSVQMNPHIRP